MARSLKDRVARLEAAGRGAVDIAALLRDRLRRDLAGEPPPPDTPITGNSKLANALRAARRRVGIAID